MATQSPLAQARSLAGTKQELIDKLTTLATEALWTNRMRDSRGWKRLSNARLVRLHTILTEASKRFASRAEIIDAIAKANGHAKDNDYKKGFEGHTLPRLMDALGAAENRVKLADRKKARAAAPRKKAASSATATVKP